MTCYFMDKNTILSGSPVPLGYAVDGKELMLLDDNGSNVASNQVGEIAVKSCYLSPGYWQRPDLTTMAFSAASNTGQRVFRTGNLGYMEPDGRLEHHGRKDFLVKLRGHRIETQEIELALLDHPGVREAAVVAYERHAEKHLGAYWVPRRYPPPAVSDLRRFLNGRLPDYMVPSVFLMLKALPLTPNGKLDRGALPEPGEKRPELSTEYTGPTQEIEKSLVSIWEEVLDVWPVGIHDNFFELGGHSLLAMRILSAVNDAFGVEVSLRGLLDAPTVAGLAEQIELLRAIGDQRHPAVSSWPCPLIAAAGRDGAIPLSYAEEGLWLIEQIQPGMSAWNMQSRLRLRGSLNVEALKHCLNTLIQRHETLRTAYRLVDGKPVRVMVPVLIVELPISQVDTSLETDAEINRISAEDEKQPFDLAEVPLFRARLLGINERDHVLIVNQHHIITDAWSSNVFLRELFALYDAYSKAIPRHSLNYRCSTPTTPCGCVNLDKSTWSTNSLTGERS